MSWSEGATGRLSPRELHIFLSVAEAQNMGKAADALAMSRPVVSRTIASLEHRVGQKLFDRAARGVRLTAAGEVLRGHAFAVLDTLRQAGLALAELRDARGGELRVGGSEPIAAGIMGAAIGVMHRRHPGLRIELHQVTGEEMTVYIRERRGDLAVSRANDLPIPDDIAHLDLTVERLVPVAGRRHALARRRRVTLEELLEAPWILSSREADANGPFMRALRLAGHGPPRRLILTHSLNLRLHLLSEGEHVTLVPESVLRFGEVAQYLVPLPVGLPGMERTTAVFWLRNRSMSAAAAAFVSILKDLVAQVPSLRPAEDHALAVEREPGAGL